jgi:hypothetical protein
MVGLRKSVVKFIHTVITVEQTSPLNDSVPDTINDHQPKSCKEKAASNINNNFEKVTGKIFVTVSY